MRVREQYDPQPKELAGKNGILTVLSKTRGWLTVTPERPYKKNPIDKSQPPQK
jgi:hypothetical protein